MSADLKFPSAAQRAAMRAAPALDLPLPAGNSALLGKPAADFVLELPHDFFDRPGSRPAGNREVVGESPPLDPATVGVSGYPAAGVPVAAMEAVMIERIKHFDNGHDLAADVAAIADNPRKLSRRADRFMVHAIEDLQFHRPGYRSRAKHHIAQAAAMLLAFYDAVDAEDDRDVV